MTKPKPSPWDPVVEEIQAQIKTKTETATKFGFRGWSKRESDAGIRELRWVLSQIAKSQNQEVEALRAKIRRMIEADLRDRDIRAAVESELSHKYFRSSIDEAIVGERYLLKKEELGV